MRPHAPRSEPSAARAGSLNQDIEASYFNYEIEDSPR